MKHLPSLSASQSLSLPFSILLLCILLLFSCKTPQVTTERILSDTTIIREIPKVIEVPGDTLISNPINLDSLLAMLNAGISPKVIERLTIREDPETGNRIGILIDELGNLTALCEIQEQQIQYLQTEIERIRSESTTTTITQPLTFWQRIKAAWDLLTITIFIAIIAIILIRRL